MIKLMKVKPLIIVGASARAAAFSAYRAGYTPYWLDQFGDEDLRQRFRGEIISDYPKEAVALIGKAPDAPFIFTGALENHPGVLEELCRQRTLLGNMKPVCHRVRDPSGLNEVFRRNGIPCPDIKIGAHEMATPTDWLIKPRYGSGGIGVGFYDGQTVKADHYLQQYLPGESFSAVYIGGRGGCRLLGVTRQLIGMPEFHAREFGYCGSIGPIDLDDADKSQWNRIGAVVAGEFGLRGLFGIDAIWQGDKIYPVEVNPRYTASVEVLELALGIHAVKFHCDASRNRLTASEAQVPRRLLGKAILYAPEDLTFKEFTREGFSVADIPAQGAEIKQGQPILTIMVTGNSINSISRELKQAADHIIRYQVSGKKYADIAD